MPFYYYAGGFYVQLIKRSLTVSQPGDLSFPGGMMSPVKDRILRFAITSGMLPIIKRNPALNFDREDPQTFGLQMLFLASAVREAWEEVRLNPYHIVYLGPLPTYTLQFFQRIIFPSVCFIGKKSRYQMNEEVERLVRIPLAAFFNPDNYYRLLVQSAHSNVHRECFPCLLFKDKRNEEHILWGATFFLMMNFLRIVYRYEVPAIPKDRFLNKTLSPGYHRNH